MQDLRCSKFWTRSCLSADGASRKTLYLLATAFSLNTIYRTQRQRIFAAHRLQLRHPIVDLTRRLVTAGNNLFLKQMVTHFFYLLMALAWTRGKFSRRAVKLGLELGWVLRAWTRGKFSRRAVKLGLELGWVLRKMFLLMNCITLNIVAAELGSGLKLMSLCFRRRFHGGKEIDNGCQGQGRRWQR